MRKQPAAGQEPSLQTVDTHQAKVWLPLPCLVLVMSILWALDLRQVFHAPRLLLLLNFLFSTAISVLVAYLLGRSFLVRGESGLLLIANGVLAWGLASLVAVCWGVGDPNQKVTIYNLAVCFSAMLHWAGAVLVTRRQVVRWPGWWLGVSLVLVLLVLGLITNGAELNWLPVFFVPGKGSTPVRQVVLSLAIGLFGATGWRLWRSQQRPGLSFLQLYGVGLGLVGAGLAGVLLGPVFDGVSMWAGRFTQYLGGVYMLVAALFVVGSSRALQVPWVELLAQVEREGQAELRGQPRLRLLMRLAGAVLGVGLGFGLWLLVQRWSGEPLPPYIAFTPFVIVVALVAGLGPGLLATALTMLVTSLWVLEPSQDTGLVSPADRIGLLLFAGTGISISVIAEVLRRVRHVAAAQQRSLALHTIQERYRAFIETTSQGVARVDLRGQVQYLNEPMAQLLGYTVEELLGRSIFELIFAADQAAAADLFARVVAGGKLHFEFRLRRQDGAELWTAIAASPLRDDTWRIESVLGMISDITGRKQAEQLLAQRAAQLEALNNELTQFNQLMVGRELRMIELKREINALCRQAGQAQRYEVDGKETGK